ncbi:peptidyl-prolyl cis-trans isomerase FKBP8-like [Oscarella lobularis]|uniref:peptidyl-prolyl cis-trans isomerase FKBP8-like n=1 Tax=Oscarella lobularis TaxID=121494 RepID=UPI0033131257
MADDKTTAASVIEENDATASSNTEETEEKTPKEGSDWLDILGTGALRKKILRSGKGGEESRPKPSQRATIRLEERLEDGTIVEEKRDVQFYVNEMEVLAAIDMVVCLMEVEEIALVESESRFAYGTFGLPPKVAPNSKMIFEIELVKVEPSPPAFDQTLEEFLKDVERKRLIGNKYYKREEYNQAVSIYKKAIDRLDSAASLTKDHSVEGDETLVRPLQIAFLNNCAAAYLQLDMHKETIELCDRVLKLDSQNTKAHFRKGKAFASMGDFKQALKSFQEAQKLDPNDTLILKNLRSARKDSAQQTQKEKNMYAKMMKGLEKNESKKEDVVKANGTWLKWGTLLFAVGAVGALISMWWVKSN